jgi:hypothetical protein
MMVSPSIIFAGPVTSANDGRAATAPKSKIAAWRSIKRSYYAVAQVEGANSRYRTGGDDRRGQLRTSGPQSGIDPRLRPSSGGVVETAASRISAPQRAADQFLAIDGIHSPTIRREPGTTGVDRVAVPGAVSPRFWP